MYPNIEAERARKGWTIDYLVKKLGICRKTYYNWTSKGNIPKEKLVLMADLFNVSTDYLLGLAEA